MVWLSALASPLERSQGEEVVSRLNMPRSWRRVVGDAIYLREISPQLEAPVLANSELAQHLDGRAGEAVLAASISRESPVVRERLKDYLCRLRRVALALDGEDLLCLGVAPGPEVGRILELVRTARLDGGVATREEQLRMVREILADASKAGTTALGEAP